MDAGTLVADIDDADAALRELVPDGLDVAALEAEHPIDPPDREELGDQFGNGARTRRHARDGAHSATNYALLWEVDYGAPLMGFVFMVALRVDYNIFLMTRVRAQDRKGCIEHDTGAGDDATGPLSPARTPPWWPRSTPSAPSSPQAVESTLSTAEGQHAGLDAASLADLRAALSKFRDATESE